jgi:AraC-like DNA-binding protein/mannose-6-phosphate isomerase-like protein (cupin superfamily)
MVKNTRFVAAFDTTPRPVVAVGNDYPDDFEVTPHHHGRGQFLHGSSGVMTVRTEHGAWVVPPEEAVWIPAGVEHSLRMIGPVSTRSLFITAAAAPAMPTTCQVFAISPLMRELLLAALDLPLEYDLGGRDGLIMALALVEVQRLRSLPLSLPFPAHPRLGRRCRRYLAHPQASDTIDDWAKALAMSRRSFTRLFKEETGMGFAHWARQACLLSALRRLALGEAVTTVALDLGYESPAAFTTMFKKSLAVPPSRYFSPSHGRAKPDRPDTTT